MRSEGLRIVFGQKPNSNDEFMATMGVLRMAKTK